MDRENFEDNIRKKFEGQTIKAPNGIWSRVEGANNADLLVLYSKKQTRYKWLSIAAILIAAITLGAQYFKLEDSIENSSTELTSYNALLSGDYNNQTIFYPHFSTSGVSLPEFKTSESSDPSNNLIAEDETTIDQVQLYSEDIGFIPMYKPTPEIATVDADIYRYYTLQSALETKKRSSSSETKVWAGLEAGAGNFGSEFSNSGAIASAINPSGLAAAVGTGNFVNPTTNISQEMDDGLARTVGFDFGVQFGKRWTLESGLAYTSMDNKGSASINVLDVYTVDNTEFIDNPGGLDDNGEPTPITRSREGLIEVEENYDHEVELNNNVQLASIPVKAGYFVVNKKFSLRLNAGLSANYLVNGSISDPSKEILNSSEFGLYNDWSFDGIGGLELGYSIFDKFNFTLEPNYRHAITPLSNSVNAPSRFVIQTGLRYTLK
ncbi:outer membrane beta-barrel protein [Ekhidna sp.]|uniref:outer membrane beta-barrel protein n=1 Tax=Ekhidna sp. TaxID=2608089 RepID=UPI00351903D3